MVILEQKDLKKISIENNYKEILIQIPQKSQFHEDSLGNCGLFDKLIWQLDKTFKMSFSFIQIKMQKYSHSLRNAEMFSLNSPDSIHINIKLIHSTLHLVRQSIPVTETSIALNRTLQNCNINTSNRHISLSLKDF